MDDLRYIQNQFEEQACRKEIIEQLHRWKNKLRKDVGSGVRFRYAFICASSALSPTEPVLENFDKYDNVPRILRSLGVKYTLSQQEFINVEVTILPNSISRFS